MTTGDQYEAWLADMDDQLDVLRAQVPTLDGSPGSIAALEAWLLERFPTFESTSEPTAAADLDLAARYIGELLRTRGGMRWTLQDNAERAWFGLPVVTDARGTLCPLTLATATTDRRTGQYLSGVLTRRLT